MNVIDVIIKRVGGIAACAAILGAFALVAPANAQRGQPPAPVRVAPVALASLAPTIRVAGTVVSREESRVAARYAGPVLNVAEVGTVLEKGGIIAQIDATVPTLAIAENQGLVARERSRIQFLESEVRRLRSLAAQNNAARSQLERTESDLDVARSELRVAEARLQRAEVDLYNAQVRAPFAGVVTERLVRAGEFIAIGSPVARMLDPNRLELVARAPLASVRFVQAGLEVLVEADTHQSSGVVRTMVPFGDNRSHMFEMRIELPPQHWTAGENARVAVPTAAPRDVLAVPRDALVLRRGGTAVFRVNPEQTAERVEVIPGFGDGVLISVEGDLSPGDQVIVRGAERLRDGQPVSVLDNVAPAGVGGS